MQFAAGILHHRSKTLVLSWPNHASVLQQLGRTVEALARAQQALDIATADDTPKTDRDSVSGDAAWRKNDVLIDITSILLVHFI